MGISNIQHGISNTEGGEWEYPISNTEYPILKEENGNIQYPTRNILHERSDGLMMILKEKNTERRKESRNRTFDLQERFIKYAADIIKIVWKYSRYKSRQTYMLTNLKETDELIAILVTNIYTAQRKKER